MNEWTVIIKGKKYFSIYFIGETSTNFNLRKLPKKGLFRKIKDYVKENRELFLKGNPISAKIAGEDVKFKKRIGRTKNGLS